MADPINSVFDLDKQAKFIEEYQKDIRAKYRMVFKEGVAREVLGDILALCGFPGTTGSLYFGLNPDDKAMIGKFNVGLEIAEKAGVLRAIGEHILGLAFKEETR